MMLVRTRGVTYQRPDPGGPVLVTAQAGHPWLDLVRELAAEELVGMETMTGIPGTIGAMPVQNVGAYGQETADTLVSVLAWDWQHGETVRLSAAECGLGHRTSRFKRSHRWLILAVTFALTPGRQSAPVRYRQVAEALDVPLGSRVPTPDLIAAVEKVRAGKGMLLDDAGPDARTVGSVFLSPRLAPDHADRLRAAGAPVHQFPDGSTRVSASWLMRDAGLALGELRTDKAVPHFLRLIKDGNESLRAIAASSLGLIGDKRAVEPLLAALNDEAGNVRAIAASSLGCLGDGTAVPHLEKALGDNSEAVRKQAAAALSKIRSRRK